MERVVVGYDGSPAADSALEWVSDRALRGDRRVEVVLVARRLSFGPADEDRTLDRAETLLASRVPGLPVETRRLGGSMPDTLVDAADGAGLLVVGVDRGHPIRAALLKGGNTDVTIRELPKLNHLFQHCESGSPGEYAEIEETFAPEVLEIMTEWIKKRTG